MTTILRSCMRLRGLSIREIEMAHSNIRSNGKDMSANMLKLGSLRTT